MRSISIKAVLAGNLGYALIFAVASLIVVLAAFLFALAGGPTESAGVQDTAAKFVMALYPPMIVLSATGAGYIAARIARTRELLHGTLSSVLAFAFEAVTLVYGPLFPDGNDIHLPAALDHFAFASPLLGALGGYLAAWRVKYLARATAAGELSGPAGPLVAVRWMLAFCGATLTYVMVRALLVMLGGAVGGAASAGAYLIAAALSVVLTAICGVAIVPAFDRRIANVVFIAFGLLLALAAPVGHALFSGPRNLDYAEAFAALLGSALAYWHLRRMRSGSAPAVRA